MAKAEITTRILRDEEYPRWNQLVSSSPQGSIYSTPEYLTILCNATGGTFDVVGVFRGEELCAGIGLYRQASRFGTVISNRLLLYYNSIILPKSSTQYPSRETARTLEVLTALEEYLSRLHVARLRVHSRWPGMDARVFAERGWQVQPTYTYVVPLTDLDQLWERMDKNSRRLITRCETRDVRLTIDDDFDSFYRLHYQTHVRKGAPLYLPENRYREYFASLRSLGWCQLYHLRNADGQSLATQLVLTGNHSVSHTVCAGANPDSLDWGTTYYLRWRTFQELADAGYEANDLTDAALNPVTKFKSLLGGNLTMNLVISQPDRTRYRTGKTITRFLRRGANFLRRRLK